VERGRGNEVVWFLRCVPAVAIGDVLRGIQICSEFECFSVMYRADDDDA
jgi:hypothetical protein